MKFIFTHLYQYLPFYLPSLFSSPFGSIQVVLPKSIPAIGVWGDKLMAWSQLLIPSRKHLLPYKWTFESFEYPNYKHLLLQWVKQPHLISAQNYLCSLYTRWLTGVTRISHNGLWPSATSQCTNTSINHQHCLNTRPIGSRLQFWVHFLAENGKHKWLLGVDE